MINWLQENVFYTDEKTKQINDAARARAGNPPPGYNPERNFPATKPGNSVRDNARRSQQPARTPGGGVVEFFNPFDGKEGSLAPLTDFFNPFDGKAAPGATPNNPRRTDRLDRDERELRRFGREGINPRTGLPYSESPGKSGVAPNSGTEEPARTGGRNDSRVIPGSGGQTQTGTNMGKVSLPELDMSGIALFNGPSFPTQPGTNKITSGYANTGGDQTPASADDAILYAQSRGALDDMKSGATTDEALLHAQGNGGLDGFKPGGQFSGAPTATEGLSAALADKSGMRFDATKYEGDIAQGKDFDSFGGSNPLQYATSPTEMRRRSAFLDSSDSMSGLKAVEAGMGMKYAGGKHYANVDGKATEMDSDGEFSARSIKGAAPGEAQALKDKWVKALSNQDADEPQVASSAENPTKPSGTADFNVDQKVDIQAQGNAVDFMNNNAEDDFGINNKVNLNKDKFGQSGFTNQQFDATKFYVK